jgi:SMI1/KNR4 family protein SUKH-1
MSDLLIDAAKKIAPIEAAFEVCDDDDVQAIEAKAGFKLPATYVSFLKTYGRCMFAGEATVRCPGEMPPLRIDTMFGCGDSAGDILADMRRHPEYRNNGLVPIADDNFNNRYVLRKTGEVLFIDYSRGPTSINKIADSFDAFLAMLDVRTLS